LEVVLERIVPPPPPPPPPPFPMRRKLAIGAASLSVVSLVVSGILWDDAGRHDGFANHYCAGAESCRDPVRASNERDKADLRRGGAYVGAGLGVGAAVAAAVLWVTGAESRVTVAPRAGPVAGLDLAVRF
ncbi:MAG: hypothetical protein ACRDMZ_24025, partial [Solirubrobacteraceae bacterium]